MNTDINVKYPWIPFYEAVADKLLERKSRKKRENLNQAMADIANSVGVGKKLFVIENRDVPSNPSLILDDISPFTVFFFMSYSISDIKRRQIISEIADFLNISKSITLPNSFEGLPTIIARSDGEPLRMNYRDAHWHDQEDEHLYKDKIWRLFELSLKYADGVLIDSKELKKLYMDITSNKLGGMLTTGLYCVRPQKYLMTNSKIVKYINEQFGLPLSTKMNADDYFSAIDAIGNKLKSSQFGLASNVDIVVNSGK